MASNKGLIFVQELVVGFGFLYGLWIYAEVNPEAEILRAFTNLIPEMSQFLFWFISILLVGFSILITYMIGRWFGIIAVLLAFIGGIVIASSWGVWLLIGGILLGLYAPMAGTSSE